MRSLFFSYIWRVKNRWYISILVLTLLVLGNVANKQQVTIPNQEIVLQFTSGQVSIEDTKSTIANVKQRLASAGIVDIQVEELQQGRLKIAYYSSNDVESIKVLLSEDKQLQLDHYSYKKHQDDQPSEEDPVDYNFDVYEIKQSIDLSDVDGKLSLETKAENDRFFNPNINAPSTTYNFEAKERIEQVAFNFRKELAIAIDKHSYRIPEVRAGPLAHGMYLL